MNRIHSAKHAHRSSRRPARAAWLIAAVAGCAFTASVHAGTFNAPDWLAANGVSPIAWTTPAIVPDATVNAAIVIQLPPLLVTGSLPYNQATGTGFKGGVVAIGHGVNASGTAVANVSAYVSGRDMGGSVVRWDAAGTAATVLGNLGTDSIGRAYSESWAINSAGTAVGRNQKFVAGADVGLRAVRWDAGSAVATELGNLGTDASGTTSTFARAINDAGTVIGTGNKYVGGVVMGSRAIRWEAGGTTATELGSISIDPSGHSSAEAIAINAGGTIVGAAGVYNGSNYKGNRAVRWDAGGTAATELATLGTDPTGMTFAQAYAINTAGTAAGSADKYVNGIRMGTHAVRWDAGGTAATELDSPGSISSISANTSVYVINDAGTAVGYAMEVIGGNNWNGRAVRWDAGTTAATELANLGTDSLGYTDTRSYGINNAGIIAGYSRRYVGGINLGNHAVIWLPDASVIDLNDLGVVSVPAGGTWTLTETFAISDNGWVAGRGEFDPDGTGLLASYTRGWVAQLGFGGNWLNTSNTNNAWGSGDNWSTGTPAIQFDAVFTANAAYSVNLDADQSCRNLSVSAGNLTLAAGGHRLTVAQTLALSTGTSLTVGPSAAPSTALVSTLTLAGAPNAWTAKLDLANNNLIVAHGAAIPNQLKQGANLGRWDGTAGITSSTAQGAVNTSLGYATGAQFTANTEQTTFAGQPFSPSDTLVMYTLAGDGNMDGGVTFADFLQLQNHYNQPADWLGGDYDYDGNATLADFLILQNNYNQTLGEPELQLVAASGVPEPASLALVVVVLGGSLIRRRRSGRGD